MANLRNFSQQCKLFRLNLVLCVSIKGVQTSQSYTTLSRFLWLNRTLEGITWHYTLLRKKEINSAEKVVFFLSFFPLPLARNKENGSIESRILIGCEPCNDTGLYSAGFKEKIDVDEAVF